MASGIDIEMDVRAAVAKLKKLGRGIDERTILKGLGQRFLTWINLNFKTGGIEERWPPLSPNTIANRRAGPGMKGVRWRGRTISGSGGGSAQPLRDTGRLAQSFIDQIENNAVVIGTENQIAHFHQEGTGPYTIRAKNKPMLAFMTAEGPVFAKSVHHPGIPRRPMLPSEALANRIALETVQTFVSKLVAQANAST